MLSLLRKSELYAKLSKCQFFQQKIRFLGHTISTDGISVDEDKIKAIQDWPEPRDVKELRAFLGLAGYYRKFVPGFSKVALPLTLLLQSETAFAMQQPQQQAFRALKHLLSHTPVLAIADVNRPLVVSTDASGYAIGAVLSQDNGHGLQPVAYMSQKLSPTACKWYVHAQELFAVVQAMKQWRHYLLGASTPVIVETDHRSLEYIQTQPHIAPCRRDGSSTCSSSTSPCGTRKARTTRWPMLCHAGLIIAPLRSRSAQRPTARRRRSTPSTSASTTSLRDQIQQLKASYLLDDYTRERLQQPDKHSDCVVKDGLLYDRADRLVIPDDRALKTRILYELHDNRLAGHMGITKTEELVNRLFSWKGIREDITAYVNDCVVCQLSKTATSATPACSSLFPSRTTAGSA